MSQSTGATNGAADPASRSQSHYTLASHIGVISSLPSTQTITLGTAATKDTAMGDATSTSSPPSSVPFSPVTSAKSHRSSLPLDKALAALDNITSKANDEVFIALKHAAEPVPSVTAPETSEDQAAKPSNKRSPELQAAEDDERPKRKKPATDSRSKAFKIPPAEIKNLEQTTVANGNPTTVDKEASSSEELAQSKQAAGKRKPKAKATPKKKAASSRRGPPACPECKRRKVKCRHNQVEDDPAVDSEPTIDSTPDGAVNTEGKPHEPREVDKPKTSGPVDGSHKSDIPDAEKLSRKSNPRKKPAPKPVRAPPERTSTRDRKAPERFEDLQETPPTRASPPKKGASKVFDPYYITTNSTSRLGRADIYHLLLEDGAWTSLSAEQQMTLISMMPDSPENQRLLEKIKLGDTGKETRPQWFKASNVFGDEVAKFRADLTNGHLGKTWQAAAEQAVAERAAGEYDAWKAEEAELWWGQKSK